MSKGGIYLYKVELTEHFFEDAIGGPLGRILYLRWGVFLVRLEWTHCLDKMGRIIRATVTRENGMVEMGGAKCAYQYLDDSYWHSADSIITSLANSIWRSFKTDQVNRIWGVPKGRTIIH